MEPRRVRDVSELSDTALECNLGRRHFGLPDWFQVQWLGVTAWETTLRCECGVIRIDHVQPVTFELWSRRYDYTHADGYLLAVPATTPELRRESVRRSVAKRGGRLTDSGVLKAVSA